MGKYYLQVLFFMLVILPAIDALSASPPCGNDLIYFEVNREKDTPLIFCPDNARFYPVDVTDTLKIRINKDKLTQFVPVGSELSNLTQRMNGLEEILRAVNEFAVEAIRIANIRQKVLDARDGENYDKLYEEYTDAVSAAEDRWIDVRDNKLQPYLVLVNKGDTAAAMRMQGSLYGEENKKLAAFLKSEITKLAAAVREADRSTRVGLQMTADVAKHDSSNVSPVHLEGYDDGECKSYRFKDKLSFAGSKQEAAEINRAIDITRNISKDINDSLENKDKLRDKALDIFYSLTAQDIIIPPAGEVRKKSDEVLKMVTAAKAKLKQQCNPKQTIDAVKKYFQDGKSSIYANLAAARNDVNKLKSKINDPEFLGLLSGTINKYANIIETYANDLEAFKDELAEQEEVCLTAAGEQTEPVQNSIRELRGAIHDYLYLIVTLNSSKATIDTLATVNAPLTQIGQASMNVQLRRMGDVQDTSIDMMTCGSIAEKGDFLSLHATVVDRDPATNKDTKLYTETQRLTVDQLGWSAHADVDLLFLRRQGRDRFITAPALSYSFSWKPWTKTDGWDTFWSALNPGLGLNIATLNFEQDTTQIGVGVYFTFMKGMLSVGYGKNIQVAQDQGYVFFALRMVETIKGFQKGWAP